MYLVGISGIPFWGCDLYIAGDVLSSRPTCRWRLHLDDRYSDDCFTRNRCRYRLELRNEALDDVGVGNGTEH